MYPSFRTSFLCCIALLALAANAMAGEMPFVFHRPNFNDKSLDKPTVTPAGEIELASGVKIPVFSLAIDSGRVEGKEICRPQAKRLNIDLKPEVAARLSAYAYPMGIILVPRDWQAWSAGVGADGSMQLLFASDVRGQNYLLYSSTGACLGCAFTEGSLYFDEAKNKAQEDDFGYYRRPSTLKIVRLNQFEKAYSVSIKKENPIDGIAYYNVNDNHAFFDVQISLDKGDHELATIILNQFRIPGSPH